MYYFLCMDVHTCQFSPTDLPLLRIHIRMYFQAIFLLTPPLSPCGCYKKILSERLPSLKPYEITKPRKKSRIFYQAIFNMWFFQAYFSLQKMSVFKLILPHFFFLKAWFGTYKFPKACHWYPKKSITKTIHSTTIFSNKRTLIFYINSQHNSTFSNSYTYGFICHFHLCYNFRQHC